jgi:hyperosmotically inducible periplasmic protein
MKLTAIRALAVLVMLAFVATGCQTMTGRTAGQTIDDTTITASVKGKLVADEPANLTRVSVNTRQATVYLTGVVERPEDRTRAEQLARGVEGVEHVVNNLQIQGR